MVPFCQFPLERLHLDLLIVVRIGVLLRIELRDGEHFDEELVLELDQIPFRRGEEGIREGIREGRRGMEEGRQREEKERRRTLCETTRPQDHKTTRPQDHKRDLCHIEWVLLAFPQEPIDAYS